MLKVKHMYIQFSKHLWIRILGWQNTCMRIYVCNYYCISFTWAYWKTWNYWQGLTHIVNYPAIDYHAHRKWDIVWNSYTYIRRSWCTDRIVQNEQLGWQYFPVDRWAKCKYTNDCQLNTQIFQVVRSIHKKISV